MGGGHVATAEALLERGPDVNRCGEGEAAATPLHLAAAGGHLALARRLLGAGADVNAPSSSGTPLELAAARSNPEMIQLLLGAGADVSRASRQVRLVALEGASLLVAFRGLSGGALPASGRQAL